MEIHSRILAWRIPWTEEPGGLQLYHKYNIYDNASWKKTFSSLLLWFCISQILNFLHWLHQDTNAGALVSKLTSALLNFLWVPRHTHLLSLSTFVVVLVASSVVHSCPTLCGPMDCSTAGLPVHRQLPELTQTHVHWVGDAIQPSHPLPSPSPPVFNHSQHQGLFRWFSSPHQVAKVLEFQLQHQSFQWILRTDFF